MLRPMSIAMSFTILVASFQVAYAEEPVEPLSPSQKIALYSVLSHTMEVNIHQMRGGEANKVYLHSDGHREAVYDAEGILVQDGFNDGSYNYAHPVKDAFGHFEKDISPWIVWGTSPSDPTSQSERISAYILDFQNGLDASRKNWKTRPKGVLPVGFVEDDFPEILESVFANSKTRGLFGFLTDETEMSDKQRLKIMVAIKVSFVQTYCLATLKLERANELSGQKKSDSANATNAEIQTCRHKGD